MSFKRGFILNTKPHHWHHRLVVASVITQEYSVNYLFNSPLTIDYFIPDQALQEDTHKSD